MISSEPDQYLLVENIGRLLTMEPAEFDPLGTIENAAVFIANGEVGWIGTSNDVPQSRIPEGTVRIDAGGRLVSPGLIEPHAHPIFAGSRAAEFDLRSQGRSYLEIQQAGGGILSTVRATRAASDEELLALTVLRLDRLLANGVTVCEAKSGYALDVEGELRLLGILKQAGSKHCIDLSPTLLAHVVPPEITTANERAEYLRQLIDCIPRAKAIAESIDVFCDKGAFTLDETRAILEAGKANGLLLRCHAEQLTHTGAADLAASLGARSVEHLEYLADQSIPRLARAGTICTLLPGAALTLKLPFPDARRLLDQGCEVAIGTDLNPGSSYTENLPLMMSLACMQMGMSCAEAWRGVTVAAAKAVNRPASGELFIGARGDLVIWNAEDPKEVIQHYGAALVSDVIVRGIRRYQTGPKYT